MTIIAIVAFLFFLMLQLPIAFGMGAASALAILYEGKLPLVLVVQRTVAGIDSFVLLAVPFYILAGGLMESGGISLRLVNLAKALVGHIRGGLGNVVIVAEYIFSGISGSIAADISAVGAVLIPLMKKAGYSSPLTVSIISAASAMGILVPPCIPMIVLGGIANISVAALFAAGFLPGAMVALFLMAFNYIQALRHGVSPEGKASFKKLLEALWHALIPIGLTFVIFGGVLSGIVTATEAGAVAVLYAAIVGLLVYREITLQKVLELLIDTAVMTGQIMFLIGSAAIFAWLMASQQIPSVIAAHLLAFSREPFVFLILTMLLFILFSGFLEGLPSLVIFVPILAPIANQLHINPIHYGIVIIYSLGVGLFLPPVGVGLFIPCSIANETMHKVVKVFMPFFVVLVLGGLAVIAFPYVTTILPRLLNLGE